MYDAPQARGWLCPGQLALLGRACGPEGQGKQGTALSQYPLNPRRAPHLLFGCRIPKPETRNPKPETRNPQRSHLGRWMRTGRQPSGPVPRVEPLCAVVGFRGLGF